MKFVHNKIELEIPDAEIQEFLQDSIQQIEWHRMYHETFLEQWLHDKLKSQLQGEI